ncbi:MAG: hypothetical protein IKX65_02910 [Prevotella sp.]|nr:hypothetical protein [Prevotella sp.]
MRKVLLIYRAPQFSPNSVEKDKLILDAVGERLQKQGNSVRFVQEEDFCEEDEADVYLSMGRLPQTLAILKRKAAAGCITVNSGEGVERTARIVLDRLMRDNHIPAAPLFDVEREAEGYWLKRGDASAQSKEDVLFAKDKDEVNCLMESFRQRGIQDVLITEHVRGDLVKFYGVQGTSFFRYFYPTDDGDTKFDDEKRNGTAQQFVFSADDLQREAERLSVLTDVVVYGGDGIVREDGSFVIIDFNDWPSFSRCREEAVEAIAGKLIVNR